jgi:hypothetical protein
VGIDAETEEEQDVEFPLAQNKAPFSHRKEVSMKRFYLIPFVALSIFESLPVLAQGRLGVISGLNIATFDVKEADGEEWNSRVVFAIGAASEHPLGKNVAVNLKYLYLQKGSSAMSVETENVELKFKLAYLEIPLSLKIALGSGKKRPYLIFGPSVALLLSSKVSAGVPTGIGGAEVELDIKKHTRFFDAGLQGGAGISFEAGRNQIFLEARYTRGLIDIIDPAGPELDDADAKTKGIQLMAGILFPASFR